MEINEILYKIIRKLMKTYENQYKSIQHDMKADEKPMEINENQ